MRLFDRVAAIFHNDHPPAAPVPSSLVVNQKEDEKKLELVLERWTLACFGTELIPARQNLSIVFAPLPTLTLYSLLYLTLAEKARKRMRKICAVSEKSITSLGPTVSSLLSSLESPCSLFFRVFVDQSQIDAVNDSWTDTVQSIFGNKVVVSVAREKLADYIRANSNEILSQVVLSSGKGMIGMASASVVAEWLGKTGPFPARPFALTYRESQMHEYFVLNTSARRVSTLSYTAWWIDVRTGDALTAVDKVALILVRPYARGGILRLREELRPRHLHDLFIDLKSEQSVESRLLLPRIQLHSQAELLNKWKLSGVAVNALRSAPRSTRPIAPPFVSAYHGATIRIDELGISAMIDADYKPHSRLPHSYSALEGSIDRTIEPNFDGRLDSPFLLFLVHAPTLAPILAGCYAGFPATSSTMLRRPLPLSSVRVVSKEERERRRKEQRKKTPSNFSRIVKSISEKVENMKKTTKKKLKKKRKSMIDGATTQSTTVSEDDSASSQRDTKWREKLRSLRSNDDRSRSESRKKTRKRKPKTPVKKALTPSAETIEKMRLLCRKMQAHYSPHRKLEIQR